MEYSRAGSISQSDAADIRNRLAGKPGTSNPHPGTIERSSPGTQVLPGSEPSAGPKLSPEEQKAADANRKLRAAQATGKAFAASLAAAKELIRTTSDGN